jgi:hypothetical protein
VFEKYALGHPFDEIPAADPFQLFLERFETVDGSDFSLVEEGKIKRLFLKYFIYRGLKIVVGTVTENSVKDIGYPGIPDHDAGFWIQGGDPDLVLQGRGHKRFYTSDVFVLQSFKGYLWTWSLTINGTAGFGRPSPFPWWYCAALSW